MDRQKVLDELADDLSHLTPRQLRLVRLKIAELKAASQDSPSETLYTAGYLPAAHQEDPQPPD